MLQGQLRFWIFSLCLAIAACSFQSLAAHTATVSGRPVPPAAEEQSGTGKVSINQATAEMLAEAMNGVGLKKPDRLWNIVSSTGLLPRWSSWQKFREWAPAWSNAISAG